MGQKATEREASHESVLGTLRVADIMTASVFTLDRRATIELAAEELRARRLGGAPVLDGERVVGVVSKSDLIGLMGDGSATVERIMMPILFAVRPTDPAMTAVELMLFEGIHRALVMERGRLVGIVTPFDVMRALVRTDAETVSKRTSGEWHTAPASAVFVDVRAEQERSGR